MIRRVLGKIKRKWVLNVVYPIRYKDSYVASYIPPFLSLGEKPIIEEQIIFSDTLSSVGNGCYIGMRTIVENCSKIGHYCSISKDVKIGVRNHALNLISTSPRFYLKKYGFVEQDLIEEVAPTVIEDDVLISSNAVILEGVNIGRGAVIGAGAVVTKDVEPYSIVVGIPAKHLRYRLPKDKIDLISGVDFENLESIKKKMQEFEKEN